MSVMIEFQGETAVMRLQGPVCVSEVTTLKQSVLDLLTDRPSIQVDLAGITQIDSAGIQLLVFARREANRLSKTLFFIGMGSPVSSLAQLFNLTFYLTDGAGHSMAAILQGAPA